MLLQLAEVRGTGDNVCGGLLVTSWAQAMGIFVGQMPGRKDTDALDGFVSQAWQLAFYLSLGVRPSINLARTGLSRCL